MTDRTPSAGQKAAKTTVATKTEARIEAIEENVVRMRHGFVVPDDLPLEQVGQNHDATRQKLLEIETRALEQSGRLDELRREAGIETPPVDTDKKNKIIAGLNQKMSK